MQWISVQMFNTFQCTWPGINPVFSVMGIAFGTSFKMLIIDFVLCRRSRHLGKMLKGYTVTVAAILK